MTFSPEAGIDDPAHHTAPDAAEAPQPRSRRLVTAALLTGAFVLGVTVGVLLPVGGVGPGSADNTSASPSAPAASLADAYDHCGVADAGGELADEQTTLILDTQGAEDVAGLDYATVSCVMSRLGTPERVVRAMESTRALDGRITDSWDVFTASWSYHPDSGLDLVISTS